MCILLVLLKHIMVYTLVHSAQYAVSSMLVSIFMSGTEYYHTISAVCKISATHNATCLNKPSIFTVATASAAIFYISCLSSVQKSILLFNVATKGSMHSSFPFRTYPLASLLLEASVTVQTFHDLVKSTLWFLMQVLR